MSSRAFLCWNCRTCYRAEIRDSVQTRRCAECGREISWVSHKVRVPPKSDKAAWERLQADLSRRRQESLEAGREYARERRRYLRAQIATLSQRPENRDRSREIEKLEAELAQLEQR